MILLNYFDGVYLNTISVFLLLTGALDLVWVTIFLNDWWDAHARTSTQVVHDLHALGQATIVVSFVMILLKLVLACQLWRLKPAIQYLNSKSQFGLGMYLYSHGVVNPFIDSFKQPR